MRKFLLLFASLSASTAAFAQDDRLAAAYACLDKKLSNAGSSAAAVPQLVSVAMRECNVEVEQYLRGVEQQSFKLATNVGSGPPTTLTRSIKPDPAKAAREDARRKMVETYEKRLAEQRAKQGKS
jgi:hypothetical protein